MNVSLQWRKPNKISTGQPLDDILRNKIYRLHKKILTKTTRNVRHNCYAISDTEIMSSDRAVKIVKQNSPLDNDEIIAKGINSLIDKKDLVSINHKGKIWLRKNNLKGIVD